MSGFLLGFVTGAVLLGTVLVVFGVLRRHPARPTALAVVGEGPELVRAHPRSCHCRGTGVVDPTASPTRPCPVVWRPRVLIVPDRVGRVPRAGTR
jgi:hypothetical protein